MKDEYKIDLCFYKNECDIDWFYGEVRLLNLVFTPNDEEFKYFRGVLSKIFDKDIWFLSYKKDIIKNYLFIIEDRNCFIYLQDAYPIDMSLLENGEYGGCCIEHSKILSGELDSVKFKFLKPYVRKIKIEKLIKEKII